MDNAILLKEIIDTYIFGGDGKGIALLVLRNDNYKLYLYHEDHNPPHIHIISKDIEFSIEINNLKILAGESAYNKLRREARKLILKYISDNKEYLQNEWNRLNPSKE